MDYRPLFLTLSGIMGFHSHVETEQEIIEVHAQANAVSSGQFLIERLETEKSSRLVRIILYSPNIARVYEDRPLEHPEELVAVFQIEYKRYVTALVYEIAYRIPGIIRSGAEGTHAPSTHTVGSSRIEPLLKRHHGGVAVRPCQAESSMERDGVSIRETMVDRVIDLPLKILGVLYAKDLVYTVGTTLVDD